MKRKQQYLWLAVEDNDVELPNVVLDTCGELAKWLESTEAVVRASEHNNVRVKCRGIYYRIRKVRLDEIE